ncbi:MAG: metallophosphoesterase family protein [Candidatus Odinarchaeota archaeon]
MEQAILINPNLGHPLILNIDRRLKKKDFHTEILFVSNISDPKNFEKFIRHKIELVPILEYKWKLKKLLEQERKKRIVKIEKEAKKGFWKRLIEKIFRKKKTKEAGKTDITYKITDSKGEEFDIVSKKKIDKLKHRVFRGDGIQAIVMNVQKVSPIAIDNLNYENYCSPQPYLIKYKIFDGLTEFYKVDIDFSLSEETLDFLKIRTFLLFDIVHEKSLDGKRTNYHSLVISKNNWRNLKFVHATDLHLAERNDRIYGIVKDWLSVFRQEKLIEFAQQGLKSLSLFGRLFKRKQPSKPLTIKPLNKRFINPNNNFRKFIKEMNKRVLNNQLDFIVLTGDLVDFVLFSKLPRDIKKTLSFDYEYSNWKIFKEIILNLPQKKRRGMLKGQELICPIFTLPGNHDFRPYHYDLRWGGLYRKIGLNADEALALNDKLLANPISSITKSFMALKGYLLEFNPSLDYSIKFGTHQFIFLNSGSDSFKNVRDFLMGRPSVTGLSNRQIKYLENLINSQKSDRDNTYLFLHGPPLNPRKSASIFKKFGQKDIFKEFIDNVDEFKETVIKKLGKQLSFARIDGKFDVKFGTISSNWEKLIEFCKNHCILTLTGHTHELNEFRLGDPKGERSKVFTAPPFSLKKLENPAAVYYDLYSELYTNPKEIAQNAPFVVQTPALGLGGYHSNKLVGCYREIEIIKNKLSSFKVNFIRRKINLKTV